MATAEASKKEVDFHVESQRIAERTLPYQPISSYTIKNQDPSLNKPSPSPIDHRSTIRPSTIIHLI
jgi:hypothetical protein